MASMERVREMDWNELAGRLEAATGADAALDRAVAGAFGRPDAPFTASVEECRALAAAVRPDLRLHLGYGASGVFPYASLAGDGLHVVSDAPTVPLAILRSLVSAAAIPARSAPPAA